MAGLLTSKVMGLGSPVHSPSGVGRYRAKFMARIGQGTWGFCKLSGVLPMARVSFLWDPWLWNVLSSGAQMLNRVMRVIATRRDVQVYAGT